MPNIILKNAKLLFPLGYDRPLMDLVIQDGKVIKVESNSQEKADQTLDLHGCVVCPGFVDLHIHPTTAYLVDDFVEMPRKDAYALQYTFLKNRFANLSKEKIVEDMVERGRKLLSKSFSSGTLFARCHLSFSSLWGECSMEAFEILKNEFANQLTLQNVVPYWESCGTLWRKFAQMGKIDVVGGYPTISEEGTVVDDYVKNIQDTIDIANEYQLPLDFHVDSVTNNGYQVLHKIASIMNYRKDYTLYEKVACSHLACSGDPRMSIDDLLSISAICGKTYLSTVALTSNDMQSDGSKNSRGAFPFEQMWDSGANICVATGDVKNHLYPFGNGDILSELLTTAQVHKRGIHMELRRMFETITWNPARAMHIENYGILPGNDADLVVLNADSIENALIEQPKRLLILKHGKIIQNHLEGGHVYA